MLDSVNAARPDVLLVALGTPKQEKLIARNKARLNVGVCVGVGAAFDIISGNIPLPPLWMTRSGLEWVFRLWHDPKRLSRRYLLGNPQFLLLVLRECLARRS
jgi:N-acetylglucosaminyldiphosphoundecaprenol N-acetyl-beta-D-mannosaminyltransferase